MIFLQVFLGILAAAFVIRLLVRFRMRRWGMHGGRFGHHRHGGGRHRMRGWRLYRDLDLSRAQRDQIRGLMRELRAEMGDLRGDLPESLARVLGSELFDRISAERIADERFAALVRAKDKALDAMERLHAILTPAQRARVAAF